MSSSSESSQSSDDYRSRKHNKKHKKHKEHKKKRRKEKRHKERKLKSDFRASEQKPSTVATSFVPISTAPTLAEEAAFGPALPPHMMAARKVDVVPRAVVVGPVLPTDIPTTSAETVVDDNAGSADDDDVPFGPALPNELNAKQIELEERALSMKLAALQGDASKVDDKQGREEWMLELPEVGLRGGLEALRTLNRKFYQGTNQPDFSDRSGWTKTPNDKPDAGAKQKPGTSAKVIKNAATAHELKRDAEQERQANEYKLKHPREESLMELHQKKRRKKKKEDEDSGVKPERKTFNRDIDLKLNRIDSNQTRKLIGMAKLLDDKFTSGQTKFL